VVVALGAGGVLALAAWLEPSAYGHSTHTQLGLSPCTFFAITGVPCPMCGATTTFALMADGRVLDGFVNQPFAAVLFLSTVAVLAVSVAELVLPTDRWIRLGARLQPYEGWIALSGLVAMSAGWAWKIGSMWSLG
jgi:hypothetical protein